MSTDRDLKMLFDAATPLVEQALALTEKFAALRKAATDKKLDWGQVKALVKATTLDSQDNGKRVKAIIDKADAASAYADILGLSGGNRKNNFIKPQNLNEKNEGRRDATGPKHAAPPETTGTVSDEFNESRGSTESGRADLVRSAKSGTRESEHDALRHAPELTGQGLGVHADDPPKTDAFDTAVIKSEKLSVRVPQAGVAPGPRDTDSDALAINQPPAPSHHDSERAAEAAPSVASAAPIPESDEFNDIRGSFLDRSLRV